MKMILAVMILTAMALSIVFMALVGVKLVGPVGVFAVLFISLPVYGLWTVAAALLEECAQR